MKMNTELMVARFKTAHGDKYDYSQSVYTYGHNPVTIICREHGPFVASMYNHAKGCGCDKCASVARGLAKRVTNAHRVELIQKRMANPDIYDFSELLASSDHIPEALPVTCKLHGRFVSRYANLLRGKGCPVCGALARGRYAKQYEIAPQVKTAQARIAKQGPLFFKKAKEIHGEDYDYARVAYAGMRAKVVIVCPKHGPFSQSPMKHINQKQGCPKCSSKVSKGETEVADYIRGLGVRVEESNRSILVQDTPDGASRKPLPLELDIYLPDFEIGIEYHGRHWHADDKLNASSLRKKWELANKAGIRLIQIFDDEWLLRRSAVEGLLRSAVRQAGSIGARRLEPRAITVAAARPFLDRHHLQGFLPAKSHYGLYLDDELFAVASFGSSRFEPDTVELIRYASSCNIAGGLSKLIRYTGLTKLTSYCDMRHGTGHAYSKAGFVSVGLTPADYWWFKGSKRYARYECQKHKLKAHQDFAEFYADAKTERQICEAAGFRRITGVGHTKFVFTAAAR